MFRKKGGDKKNEDDSRQPATEAFKQEGKGGLPPASGPDPEKIKKKMKDGWIKSWMMIEALAVNENAVKGALEKHVKKLGMEKNVTISKRDFKKIEKVENPFPNIKEAHSGVVELEVLTKDYDRLVFLVLNYAPSAIEILEPKNISMDAGEAQGVLNSLAELIHRFVGMTQGAILVDTK